jgi:titin
MHHRRQSGAGDGSYSAAPQVTQSFSIAPPASAVAPGAPSIVSIVPGRGSAIVNLAAPTATGGSPIVAYAATCSASNQPDRTASGAGLTLTVRGLKGRVPYACTATASNAYYSSVASAALSVTPEAGGASLTPILLLLLD